MTRGLRHAALAAFLTAAMALPAQSAITFDFFWTGDPTKDATIRSSDNAALQAIGTITIDAVAGATFTRTDIIATDITVSGGTGFTPFTFTSWNGGTGTIAADGLSASFSANVFPLAGTPYYSAGGNHFGCQITGCNSTSDGSPIGASSGANRNAVYYTAPAAAAASMKMTVIPLPAGLPLLLGGLGMLALARRHRRF